MKRMIKALLALAMILTLLGGAGAERSVWAAAEGAAAGWMEAAAGQAAPGEPGAALQAKSKKKKTTATPGVTAPPTPEASAAPAATPEGPTPSPVPEGPITDPQSIADYLFSHDMQLPENFMTKRQAQALGWDKTKNVLSDVAPGMSIGGDYYGNYEQILPVGEGITYHEADCYYTGGYRGKYRIVYSSDGRVWYTEDHYQTFTELFPSTSY